MRKHARIMIVASLASLFLATAPALADGLVTAEVDDRGVLILTGDIAENAVQVVPGAVHQEIDVIGLEGTAINRGTRLTMSGVRSLRVDLRDGDDYLVVSDVRLRRDVRVFTDGGRDDVRLDGVDVRRVLVRCGDGFDNVMITGGSNIRRSVRVLGYDGDDDVQLHRSRVGGRVMMRLGDGFDQVVVEDMHFGRYAKVNLSTGRGEDVVRAEYCYFGDDVDISTHHDDDFVRIVRCYFEDDVDVELGRDDDDMHVVDSDFDEDVEFDGDRGHDELDLDGHNHFEARHHGDRHHVRFWDFEHRY